MSDKEHGRGENNCEGCPSSGRSDSIDRKALNDLALELHRIIDGWRDAKVPYSAMVGILEMIKTDIINEAIEDDD